MNRFDRMVWKMLLPGLAWMLMSWVGVEVLAGLSNNPYTSALTQTLRWVPIAIFAFGLGLIGLALFRLWRWYRGEGTLCECGGLLGREIDGRFGYYRRCLACNRNISCRHYQ